jgi:hypothetical protein
MLMDQFCLLLRVLPIGVGLLLRPATAAPVKPIPPHQLQAQQTEGQQFLDSINRAQQAYAREKQQFTTELPVLGLGQRLNTPYYNYRLVQRPHSYLVQHFAIAQKPGLRSYTGGVFWAHIGDGLAPLQPPPSSPQTLFCESLKPTQNIPGEVTRQGKTGVCPAGYRLQNVNMAVVADVDRSVAGALGRKAQVNLERIVGRLAQPRSQRRLRRLPEHHRKIGVRTAAAIERDGLARRQLQRAATQGIFNLDQTVGAVDHLDLNALPWFKLQGIFNTATARASPR